MLTLSFQVIDTEAQLQPLVDFLEQSAPIQLAIDTEFVRTRTYYAGLGLVQIYDGEHCYLVDPLNLDLSRFWPALRRHHWILHAFGEDLEIIYRLAGGVGLSVFDTQVACAFLGHGASLGFQRFIEQELEHHLDKGESRTDWLARPLRKAQLEYAAADVIYLLPAYHLVIEQLQQKQLLTQAQDECRRLSEVRKRTLAPEQAYLDVKNAWRLSPQQLSILKPLAAWRLQQAQQRDMAINMLVKAESLWELAAHQPGNMSELQALGLPHHEMRKHAKAFLAIISKAKQTSTKDFPDKIKRMIDYPEYKTTLQQLKTVVKKVAEQSGIPEDVLATKKTLHDYMQWLWASTNEKAARDPLLLSGWRKSLFITLDDREG